jgi:hypothetical protein
MSATPMLEGKPAPWDENAEPHQDHYNTIGLPVKLQWACMVLFLVWLVVWEVLFLFGDFSNSTWLGYFINNIMPQLPFWLLGVPTCISIISYRPPIYAFVTLLLIMAGPFMFIPFGAVTAFLIGYWGCVIMSFMFLAIHQGKAAMPSEMADWLATLGQPMALGSANALFYLWQFSHTLPLSYKLRCSGLLMINRYFMDGVKEVIAQYKGNTKPYNPEEFRCYRLNDTQFIRINWTRVMIIFACISLWRMVEEKVCPMTQVHIENSPFFGSYTKEIPVCAY